MNLLAELLREHWIYLCSKAPGILGGLRPSVTQPIPSDHLLPRELADKRESVTFHKIGSNRDLHNAFCCCFGFVFKQRFLFCKAINCEEVRLLMLFGERGFARSTALGASGPQEPTNQEGPASMIQRQKENASSNKKIVHRVFTPVYLKHRNQFLLLESHQVLHSSTEEVNAGAELFSENYHRTTIVRPTTPPDAHKTMKRCYRAAWCGVKPPKDPEKPGQGAKWAQLPTRGLPLTLFLQNQMCMTGLIITKHYSSASDC